jgi:hypothetical protein
MKIIPRAKEARTSVLELEILKEPTFMSVSFGMEKSNRRWKIYDGDWKQRHFR